MPGRRALCLAVVLALCGSVPGAAQTALRWTEFFPGDGSFAVEFPGTPTVSAEVKQVGTVRYRETSCFLDLGMQVFAVMIRQYEPGTLPKTPDQAYLVERVKEFAAGSETKARTPASRVISGHPALEAVTDDEAKNIHYLIDVLAVDDRLYVILSGGPQGHEASADALRFRDSFRLTAAQ